MNKLQQLIATTILGISKYKLGKLLSESESITSDDVGWVKITEQDKRGLTTIQRDRQLAIVHKLHLTNLLAKPMLDTINDFVFGDGVKYEVGSTKRRFPNRKGKLQYCTDILDRFWDDNDLDLSIETFGTDLSLNGMLCLPTFPNEYGGAVKLGFVDPSNIDTVITNPLNIREIQGIKLKGIPGFDNKQNNFDVIRRRDSKEDFNNYNFLLLDGEMFFFRINNVSNQPEGVSDLLQSADILDMFTHLLVSILKFSELQYLWYMDVSLKGLTEDEIKDWIKDHPIPNAGERIVHNEDEIYQLLSPQVKAADSSEIVRMFKNLILLSKRFPEHWFTEGGNTNLATAVAQGSPILKMLEKRQEYWKYIISNILLYVLHQAFIHKKAGFNLTREELLTIKVKTIMPEVSKKDVKTAADGVKVVTEVLKEAVANNWLSKDTAGIMFRQYTDSLGYDIDETEEAEKIRLQIEAVVKEGKKEEEETDKEETEGDET